MNSILSIGSCKDCGTPFALTTTARTLDVARGLSEPERCPKCRKVNAEAIRSRGAAYWAAPVETDDSKRCWGKYGLAKLVRAHPVRDHLPNRSIRTDLPLLYAKDPAAVQQLATSGQISNADLEIAAKFSAIADAADRLVKNLEDPNGTRVSVLVGPTGTGKSTWVPYAILRSKVGQQGRICVTQPRLITLKRAKDAVDDRTTPGFIARHLMRAVLPDGTVGVGAGHEIGFQHSGEYEQQDRYTKLLFVSDGTVVKWLETGRVGQFDVLMVDEAHEQNANMERIFALLKYRLALYPRLRVVIASATIDIDKFRTYFGNDRPESVFLAAPSGTLNTTRFPIHDRWIEEWKPLIPGFPDLINAREPRDRGKLLPQAVASVVRAICTRADFTKIAAPSGDILVFAPTIATVDHIRAAVRTMATQERLRLDVHVSHRQMSPSEHQAFKKSEAVAENAASRGQSTAPQRVIVATNYAETSVTMANLRYVIDSGLILEPGWNPKTCSNRYEPQWHSQAGCTQRKGRVGRTQPGECFRLYTQTEFSSLQPQSPPEITRQPLDSFLLSAKAAGIEDLASFEWLGRAGSTAAPREEQEHEFKRSQQAVTRRGAFDGQGDITGRGLELGGMQVSRVELAECLSLADSFACGLEVATFLSFIDQDRSPFRRGQEGMLAYGRWRSGCYDDLEFYLRVHHLWSNQVRVLSRKELDVWAEGEGISSDFMNKVSDRRKALLRQFSRRAHTDPTERELDLRRLHRVRLVLARALFEWVYVRTAETPQVFRPVSQECPCSTPVEIERDSACVAAVGLESFVCVERLTNSRGKLFARHIVRVNPSWLSVLESAQPIGLALLLKRTVSEEAEIAARSSAAVTSKPAFPMSLSLSQSVAKFRAIRHDKESGFYLAEEVDLGFPVLLKTANARVEPGDILRATVVKADPISGRCEANQDSLLAWYQKNAATPHTPLRCVVRHVEVGGHANSRGKVFLECEPGVRARLNEDDMEWAVRKLLPTLKAGQGIEIRVKRVTADSKIDVITSQAFEGRRRKLKVNEEIDATITRIVNTVGVQHGLELELLPGVRGFLPRDQISAVAWGSLSTTSSVGAAIRVVVVTVKAAADLEVVEHTTATKEVIQAASVVVREGSRFQGKVIGFHPTSEKREAVDVEFLPGKQGRVWGRHFGSRVTQPIRMAVLRIGQSMEVTVDQIRPDKKYDLRLDYQTRSQIKKGQTFQGLVDGFLDGKRGREAVFVEIIPGINGFLHASVISPAKLSSLKSGDPIYVKVSQVSSGKISLVMM